MKKSQLRQIIKEEISNALNESASDKIKRIFRNISPQEFTNFLNFIGEYDLFADSPEGIDAINSASDRIAVFDTFEEPEAQKYIMLWKKYLNSKEN
jgi:hypothetical protein